MPRVRPTVFIVNPAARGVPSDLPTRLKARFPGSRIWSTNGPGEGAVLARRAVAEWAGAPGLLVSCGGDGTFREVASAAGDQDNLGLLPVGTVNLVASELGIPSGLDDALAVLASGVPTPIYPGVIYTEREQGVFFIGVSVGPDSDAVHGIGRRQKRFLGRYAYALAFVRRLARPVCSDVRWECNGAQGRCAQFVALRMPHYGGKYRISDTCSLFSPGLETVCVDGSRLTVFRFFLSVLRSALPPALGVQRMQIQEVTVRLPPHGRFQMDGDPFTARAVRLSAANRAVRVIAPQGLKG